MYRKGLLMISLSVVVVACHRTMPPLPAEQDLLDGPVEGLSHEAQIQFLRGDEAFGEIFTLDQGLGPVFVANQCAACHPGDGKGSPFVGLTRFGQADTTGNTYLDRGGPQLQHHAIPGYKPEVLPAGAPHTRLLAPAVTGLGYLDAVEDATLLALSDPDDLNNDGISGRPHWSKLPSYVKLRPGSVASGNRYITRFGKKAGAYDLLHQTAMAYNQDMGITSLLEPIDPYSGNPSDPEVDINTLNDVVFYLKTLKSPIQRNPNDAQVVAGKKVFLRIDCGKCHIPEMITGPSEIPVLSNKRIHAYTDLLLHDMGPALDDGYTEGYALSSEWRTPPLWGLGLTTDAQGGRMLLLHDGRATSIHDAILFHGGEALNSRNKYGELSEEERKLLILFLKSL